MHARGVARQVSGVSPLRYWGGEMMKPRIYFAGKIAANCWRHDLVPQLRGWQQTKGPIDCGSFIYTGPFFASCDHKCRHGDATHGVLGIGCMPEIEETRNKVFKANQADLGSSSRVFAYIAANDCYGTLFELGWAGKAGIPIFIVFAPSVEIDEFWYAQQQMATILPKPIVSTRSMLPALFQAYLAGGLDK